jgi:chemotaxis protein CheX
VPALSGESERWYYFMNVEYINPFIEASQTVLKQIAGIDVKLGSVSLKTSPYTSDNIVILVGLTGKIRGQAIFSMNKIAALTIASGMMGGAELTELDEISKSALSELTNMILGNTATILYNRGIGVEITPPSFLVGENMQISPSKMKTICIPLLLGENKKIELDISVVD